MADEIIGIIGGTGLGEVLAGQIDKPELIDVETPFGKSSDAIMLGRIGNNRIAYLNRHGKGHRLGPSEVPYAANVFALKKIGVRALIATGAAGSLREEIRPGEVVIVDQFIDKTFKRRSHFFDGFGAVHCEMSAPVCRRLSRMILKSAKATDCKAHSAGTYVCMEGPQFSTHAESLMHRSWGGDLIGMTAMPEAKLAREAQICYALMALVSDYDCWRPHKAAEDKQNLLAEIIANLQTAVQNGLKLLDALLTNTGPQQLSSQDCPCRKTLELAVWTDAKYISRVKKGKLKPLFD